MNPVVEVQEISDEQVTQLIKEHNPRGVDLGGAHSVSAKIAEANVDYLISHTRKHGGRRFLLVWEGDKIPTGARILDFEINWTQNGQVLAISTEGTYAEDIGTYDRLVEFGGASGKQQKMLVYLYPTKSSRSPL